MALAADVAADILPEILRKLRKVFSDLLDNQVNSLRSLDEKIKSFFFRLDRFQLIEKTNGGKKPECPVIRQSKVKVCEVNFPVIFLVSIHQFGVPAVDDLVVKLLCVAVST